MIVAGRLCGAEHGDMPESAAAIGVEGINTVVFGGDEQDVVRLSGD